MMYKDLMKGCKGGTAMDKTDHRKMNKPMNNTNHNNVTDTPESHIVFKI